MTAVARPRRSVLYMPGSNARALEKARSIPADALILDLEDAVAPDAKAEARAQVTEAVRDGWYGKREIIIRVNGLTTDWGEADIEAAVAAGPDGVLDLKIKVSVTCVRGPVFVGHSESVNIEFENEIDDNQAREILRAAPGVLVVDKHEDGGYVTPVDCVGDFAVFVSRVRVDPTLDNGLSLWCVSDNLRKGAALNAIQIAELLLERGLIKAAA
jgi:Semialdehyde dehydrogenase, dimerisation domain/HpcH/HpaI aldolase/citrate lyase family